MKLIIACAIVSMSLVGCGATVPVIQDKYIPIPICPKPPEIEKPAYYANTLSDEQMNDMGELAKAYVISGKEAVNNTVKLQMMYDAYVKLAEDAEARLKAIESMGGVVDRSMMEQSNREVQSQLQALSLQFDAQDENLRQSLNQMDD